MYYEIVGRETRLIGSQHVLPTGCELPDFVGAAYDWSRNLVFEHRMEDSPDIFICERPFAEYFDPSELTLIQETLGSKFNPLLKGWALSMLVATALVGPVNGGVEIQLKSWNRFDRKRASYLESPREFAALLDPIPVSDSVARVREMLSDPKEVVRRFRSITDLWLEQKVHELFDEATKRMSPEFVERLYFMRNRKWLHGILTMPPRTLVIVGAGHLSGASGLLEVLGDRIQPVA